MILFTAPESNELDNESSSFKVFLAGTIDSGNSLNWQQNIIDCLSEQNDNLIIFNPRRSDWPEDLTHDEIEKQINWELENLEKSNLIIMNILPDSKSPISLLEIGLFAHSHKLIIFCTEDFYRFDNIKIVTDRYNISLFRTNDIDLIVSAITMTKEIYNV